MMTKARLAGCLFLASLALLLAGCASAGFDSSCPPRPYRESFSFGPFFEWNDTAAYRSLYLRPIYNRRTDKLAKLTQSELLWPVGFGTQRPDLKRSLRLPLYLRDRETFSDGTTQSRLVLLPLLYYRSARNDQPRDLMVFPLGANLHGVLGRDRILFALWPLYVYQEGRGARSWSVLYPIFARIKWDDGGRGFKAWPLFGWNRRPDNKLDKRFILWPFYHRQHMENAIGTYDRWWLFPFYGRIDDPNGYEWSVLWPFFGHRVDRAMKEEDRWYLWPILGRHLGQDRDGRSFWPLFVTMRRGPAHRVPFLWPFGWYWNIDKPQEKLKSFRIVPLMFWEKETVNGAQTSAWQIWPLVKKRNEKDGTHVELFSLFPARAYEPWERNYAPLFRLFEYHRTPEGRRSWGAFWRLIKVDSNADVRYVDVGPFYSGCRVTGAMPERRWSVLKGLAGWERTTEGRRLRLLYFLKFDKGRVGERTTP